MSDCQRFDIPVETCLLRFGTGKTTGGEHIGDTIRNEMIIAHYDAAGRIVELELVGDGKRCQAQA